MQLYSGRGPLHHLPLLAAVAALTILAALLLNPKPVFDQTSNDSPPGLALALTAEARQQLQTTSNAFPEEEAGFSAFYRVPSRSGGYGLDKGSVDGKLHDATAYSALRSGTGQLRDMGDSHSVTTLSILNIGNLITEVDLYYDDQGWLVAYFDRGASSSQVWQAKDLDNETPKLTDVSHTVLLDAINAVVHEILRLTPVTAEDLGYYHWAYPDATKFLMMASARVGQGADTVSFAVPPSFNVHEVSVSWWAIGEGGACANVMLDDAALTNANRLETGQCVPGWAHHQVNDLARFNALPAHTMQLEQSAAGIEAPDQGATGALLMLVYSP